MPVKMPRWTSDEKEILTKYYEFEPIEKLLELLPGRSQAAIQWKANNMGLMIRDGRQVKATYKIIINLTESHYNILKSHANQSRIIREALNMYFEREMNENRESR